MATRPEEKLMLAEQLLEVRYTPSGSFLDVRGFVADYIREDGFLKHWKIEANIVHFRDTSSKVEREGAFAGYRNAGYLAFNPETRNFFVERAGSFWRILQKNTHYTIPPLERFGARTKVFLPSEKLFDEINNSVWHSVFAAKALEVVGGIKTDAMFVFEIKDQGFDVRIMGGPIHNNEARQYLRFESQAFEKAGFFVDVDYARTQDLKHGEVPKLLQTAVNSTWTKIERLATVVGV